MNGEIKPQARSPIFTCQRDVTMRALLATLLFALLLTAIASAKPVSEHRDKSVHRLHVDTRRVTLARHQAHVLKRAASARHQAHISKRVASVRHHPHVSKRVASARNHAHVSKRVRRHFVRDGRPRQWCGWFMRQVLGVTDRAYNLALNWAHWGRSAHGPQIGAVVVWRHHVGLIKGGPTSTAVGSCAPATTGTPCARATSRSKARSPFGSLNVSRGV